MIDPDAYNAYLAEATARYRHLSLAEMYEVHLRTPRYGDPTSIQINLAIRARLLEDPEYLICPLCSNGDGIGPPVAMGTANRFCWWEHSCGAYSPSAGTWEEAFKGTWVRCKGAP